MKVGTLHPLPLLASELGSGADSWSDPYALQFNWEMYGGHHQVCESALLLPVLPAGRHCILPFLSLHLRSAAHTHTAWCPPTQPPHLAAAAAVQEAGYSGVELQFVQDCWVRDLAFIDADNGVLVSGSDRVTVRGIDISYTKPRGPSEEVPWDGHWGVRVGEPAAPLLASQQNPEGSGLWPQAAVIWCSIVHSLEPPATCPPACCPSPALPTLHACSHRHRRPGAAVFRGGQHGARRGRRRPCALVRV